MAESFFYQCIQQAIDAERVHAAERGYSFRERDAQRHTIGDFITAVLGVKTPTDAGRFFEGHVADIQRQIDEGQWEGRTSALAAAKSNIGYCFGEGMAPEMKAMWRDVTQEEHLVLGDMRLTPQEMMDRGKRLFEQRDDKS